MMVGGSGQRVRIGDMSTWIVAGFAPEKGHTGPAAPPQLGSKVGPFRILDVLGAGGMGIVYRAHDERLDRVVALKITAPGAADPELLRREARRAAQVEHAHVATVFEVGAHDGHTYIAMELVEGQSLRERLDRPLRPHEIWSIATQLADVLAHAHARGLVHRDLKPENVMLRRDGAIKVLDFGLATLVAMGRCDLDAGGGRVAGGTFGYMAPEQHRHGEADARSDVYSFGVLLHELCTGARPPREGPSPAASEAAPRRLRELVRRCLAEAPAERFADGKALAAALAARRPRRRWPVVAAAALLLAVLAGALALAQGPGPGALVFTPITAQAATVPVQDADLSPDGRTVVFSERRGLVRLDVASHDTQLVSRADTYYCARWFADGRHVAVHDRGGLGRLLEIDAFTGEVRPLPVDHPGCATPSPDGRWLVTEATHGLYLYSMDALRRGDTASSHIILSRNFGNVISRVVWSPDGTRLAVLARPARTSRDAVIYGIEVPSGRLATLAHDPWLTAPFGLAAMEWETPTRLIYVLTPRVASPDVATTLYSVEVDARTGRAASAPSLRYALGEVALADLRFDKARAHLLAVSYASDRDVYVGDLAGPEAPGALHDLERVTFSGREERMSSWSPDGGSIYFVAETARAHAAMRQALPGYPEPVGPPAAWLTWPTVRSDGAVFAWDVRTESPRAGDARVRLVRIEPSGALTEVFRPAGKLELAWRAPPPGGYRLSCAARVPTCVIVDTSDLGKLVIYDLDSGQRRFELRAAVADAHLSPDGTQLLVVHNRTGMDVLDADTGVLLGRIPPASSCGFVDADWLPDGRGWVASQVCLQEAEMFTVVQIGAALPEARRTLWGAPSMMALDLHVAPDGKRLAFTQESFANDLVLRPWRRRP
jgi:dipeptidyl aminopeptidase/acylaminoacyl peptidase